MLPINVDAAAELLLHDTDTVLERVSQKSKLSGFAYVFEAGQSEPCFYLAMDTEDPPADPSTGEWTHPAGFKGDQLSAEWLRVYAKLSNYLEDEDELESRVEEVHAFLRSVMKRVRERWLAKLPECIFTVNECNESDEAVLNACSEINGVE